MSEKINVSHVKFYRIICHTSRCDWMLSIFLETCKSHDETLLGTLRASIWWSRTHWKAKLSNTIAKHSKKCGKISLFFTNQWGKLLQNSLSTYAKHFGNINNVHYSKCRLVNFMVLFVQGYSFVLSLCHWANSESFKEAFGHFKQNWRSLGLSPKL